MALPRKGTMAAQLARPGYEMVTDVDFMPYGNFLRHCRERHPNLPFVTRNEHEQDHRPKPPEDNTHTNMQEEPGDVGEPSLAVTPKAARRPRQKPTS